jgi:hypothetical protein
MKPIVIPSILAILVVAGPSCHSNDAAPSSPVTSVDVIIPLAVGNEWVAHVASWDSSGRANVIRIDTARIVRDTTIQLERWFVDNRGNHVTNRPTGYWVLSNAVASMFLKYPVSLNDNYPYGNDTIGVVSRDTSITVPAGTFSCVCYHISYGTQSVARQILLASPNKGIVRREVVARTPSGREYLESRADLQTFQLK